MGEPKTYSVRVFIHDEDPHATIDPTGPLLKFAGPSESFESAARLAADRLIEKGNKSFEKMVEYADSFVALGAYTAHVTSGDELRCFQFSLNWAVVLESFEEVDA